jgi:hypothetical protein
MHHPAVTHAIDWGLAARLLAGGATPAETARRAGGTPALIARRQRECPRFRAWIAAGDRPDDADARTARRLEIEARHGNTRVLLHLARQRQRPRRDEEESAEEVLERIFARLTPAEVEAFRGMTHDWPHDRPDRGMVGDGMVGDGGAGEARPGGVGASGVGASGIGATAASRTPIGDGR